MKIAIIGTHFTGKTELAEALHSLLTKQGKDAVIIKETVRHCPLPLNKNATFEAQAWILAEQIKQEIENLNHEIVISDRSVIDNYAYSLWNFPENARVLLHFVLEYSKTYNYLFKTIPLDVPIKPDGFRDTDPKFRMEIDKILTGFLHGHGIKYHALPTDNPLDSVKKVIEYGT